MPPHASASARKAGLPPPPPRRNGRRRWVLLVGAAVLVVGGVGVGLFGRGLPTSDGQTLVIRRGGTYSGTYRSPDSGVPCVRIETTEPVTLQNCVLTGAGNLIHANASGAQLTVLNCRGYGLTPSRDRTRRGRFLEASAARSVRVEHNYFEQTSGISIYQWGGDGSATQTLTVRYNQCRNLDGRLRDGGEEFCNFLGLNAVPALENIEVAWNEVINEPNKSLVADNINFYNSGGTRRSPARVHDNYIQGAYPYPATGPRYDGSGITLDGDGRAVLSATAYVEAYNNQIISTCGAAMNIAAGHHNYFHDNRMVTSGQLPDGTHLPSSWAASAIWNAYKQSPDVFHSNRLSRNVIGFVHWGGSVPLPNRQDLSSGLCEACTGTIHLPNPITPQTEQAEWELWRQKLRQQDVQVGPQPASVRAARSLPNIAQTH